MTNIATYKVICNCTNPADLVGMELDVDNSKIYDDCLRADTYEGDYRFMFSDMVLLLVDGKTNIIKGLC